MTQKYYIRKYRIPLDTKYLSISIGSLLNADTLRTSCGHTADSGQVFADTLRTLRTPKTSTYIINPWRGAALSAAGRLRYHQSSSTVNSHHHNASLSPETPLFQLFKQRQTPCPSALLPESPQEFHVFHKFIPFEAAPYLTKQGGSKPKIYIFY
jgi:hypothetical protein